MRVHVSHHKRKKKFARMASNKAKSDDDTNWKPFYSNSLVVGYCPWDAIRSGLFDSMSDRRELALEKLKTIIGMARTSDSIWLRALYAYSACTEKSVG